LTASLPAVNHEVKEDGGEWVAMTHTPDITEEGPHLSINVDSRLASHDLHKAMNHHP
jgi:hypothetical protein